MKYSKLFIAVFAVLLVGGGVKVSAAGNSGVKDAEKEEREADFAVSAVLEENNIILLELSDGNVLNEIPVDYDAYKVFVNMTDENNGYMLYYSTPRNDQVKRVFCVTKDRWSTYSEMDIGFELDE